MGTYFPSSDTQRDSTQMNYFRESLPSSYSESSVLSSNMMMYMNYSSSGSYTNTLTGNNQLQNSCIDIPSVGPSDSTPPRQEMFLTIRGSQMEHDFNSWSDKNEILFMQPIRGQNFQGQGLSLSLSTEIPSGIKMPSNPDFSSFLNSNGYFRDDENSQSKQSRNDEIMAPGFNGDNSDPMKIDITWYGVSNIARTIPHSKYLMAAQQLLDEVVNVRKALKQSDGKKDLMKGSKEVDGASSNPQENTSNFPSNLLAAEKQDLQNKITKLLSMLDEVDRRYKQYYHQMQIVVSSFDVVAGRGAAKPYTALALLTISRHFCCLRDSINDQIQVTRRSLGDQDASADSKGVGISRLRYVDQQNRQQRSLQHLHMMRQHTWRPQRGLPESSVSILRAWLFEHFLHPYPKDSDKITLARQTGLTRGQVSNWFINARVRLWKPMVEEIYKEEIGNAEMESNSSSELVGITTKSDRMTSEDQEGNLQQSATSTPMDRHSTGSFLDSKSDHVPEMAGINGDANFQSRTCEESETGYGLVKSMVEQSSGVDKSFFPDAIVQSSRGNEGFLAYHVSELGTFGSPNGVSLTLGLQHCEGVTLPRLPLSVGSHHSFVTTREDDMYDVTASSVGPDTADLASMDLGTRQHRFGSSHLLHYFVA